MSCAITDPFDWYSICYSLYVCAILAVRVVAENLTSLSLSLCRRLQLWRLWCPPGVPDSRGSRYLCESLSPILLLTSSLRAIDHSLRRDYLRPYPSCGQVRSADALLSPVAHDPHLEKHHLPCHLLHCRLHDRSHPRSHLPLPTHSQELGLDHHDRSLCQPHRILSRYGYYEHS